MQRITIGLDIAKTVFQVHGVDAAGQVVLSKRLTRAKLEPFFAQLPPALVGIEACASAHHWARRLQSLGHEVRLMPPAYVKPYVKRAKTDARDAEAICEAVTRPTMRFVPVKSQAQQAALALHRARDLLVRQRTQIGNALRGLCAEFGIVAAAGAQGLARLLAQIAAASLPVPEPLSATVQGLAAHWARLDADVRALEARIAQEARRDPRAQRLMAVPGIGPMTAHRLIAQVPDARTFANARAFAAWIGLTPRISASGARSRTGAITKQGDRGLRRLLVLGAAAHLRQARAKPARARPWLLGVLSRRPVKVAIVAQAAKTARIAWAMMAKDQPYRAAPATQA